MIRLAAAILLLLPAFAYARSQAIDAQDEGAGEGDVPQELPPQSFLEQIGIMVGKLTRGERNNNPGNIRKSNAAWQGKVSGADSSFETFASPEMGIRALAITLRTYQTKYRLRSVRQIIGRWAPPNENNTEAYIRAVCARLGVTADQAVDLNDAATLAGMTEAIIKHENGRSIYTSAQIETAISLV